MLGVFRGPYNGADSVHWPFIYIYIKELPIYKKESGCIPPGFGDTLSGSWFDFENLTQSVLMIQDWLIYIISCLALYRCITS